MLFSEAKRILKECGLILESSTGGTLKLLKLEDDEYNDLYATVEFQEPDRSSFGDRNTMKELDIHPGDRFTAKVKFNSCGPYITGIKYSVYWWYFNSQDSNTIRCRERTLLNMIRNKHR